MLSTHLERLRLGDAQHPKPIHFAPAYGTAGFRALAERLPSTMYRSAVPASACFLQVSRYPTKMSSDLGPVTI